MTNKKNRTCIVCSQNYRYCSSCTEFANLESWHSIFHDANCKEIFNATSMYGRISNEEIKKRLDKCDLSNKENFNKNIIKVINEVYIPIQDEISNQSELIEETDNTNDVVVESILAEETETTPMKMTSRHSKKKSK